MTLRFILFMVILCGSCFTDKYIESRDEKECFLWDAVIAALKMEKTLNLTCLHNQECTGFSCVGTLLPPTQRIVHINFDVTFLPCKNPQQLEVSVRTIYGNISIPLDVSTTRTVKSLPVPTTYGVPAAGTMHIVLNIGLQSLTNSEVKFDVNATITFEQSSISTALVPPTVIRIPSCVQTGSQNNITETDALTGMECKPNTMHSCGDYQTCHNGHLNQFQCVCTHGLVWNKNKKQCTVSAAMSTASSSPTKNVVIIVSCALLGVVAVVIVLIVVVKYRRYRQRYGQHDLLINNEGTDRDLDGDSPMLDG